MDDKARHEARAANMAALELETGLSRPIWPDVLPYIAETARMEWLRGVGEPGGHLANPSAIDGYIRGAGGLNWSWVKPYVRDEQFAWCGAFAAYCAGVAGLKHAIRYKQLASTLRIYNHLRGPRGLFVYEVKPGDILVVTTTGAQKQGVHICVAVSEPDHAGLITTIEGNARGLLGDGTVGNGVIRRTRPIAKLSSSARCPISGLKQAHWVAYAIRFAPEDFEEVEP